MKVLICDDHTLFAEAFGTALSIRGHEVVGYAASPHEAVETVQRLDVDLCIMDLHFSDGCQIDATARVLRASPGIRIMVLTCSSDPGELHAAARGGASGIAVKDDDLEHAIDVVERVHAGERVLGALGVQAESHPGLPTRTSAEALARFLTPREREVLERLTRGESTADIARAMGVRYSTARTHIQNTLSKLGVHSKLEAVVLAVNNRMFSLSGDDRARRSGPL